MKKLASLFLLISLSTITIFSFIGMLGKDNWFFDLLSHFKLQYSYLLLIGMTVLYLLRKDKKVLLFIIPLLINGTEIMSVYFGGNSDKETETSIKICSANVLSSNGQFEKLNDLIKLEKPDIVILQEVNTLWSTMSEQYLTEYEYKHVIPRNDNFGIAIYSKIKLNNLETLYLGITDVPSIKCQIKLNNQSMSLLATHPVPPIGKVYTDYRNKQLKEIAILAKKESNIVILGDLNTTSYSTHFKTLINTGNLIDSRNGFGIQSSWPTWSTLASITLDHCLISDNIIVKTRKIGQDIGSDHLPLIIEVGLK